MFKISNRNALILLCGFAFIFSSSLASETVRTGERRREIAFKEGLNWMLQHPQRIEEHVELYANELLFYYLMTERSKKEGEREFFRRIFLQRLGQSDRFDFKVPASIYETCSYLLILGLRKWSRQWKPTECQTDSMLHYHVKQDMLKNINLYRAHHPLELVFIDYVSRKFDMKLLPVSRSDFKWWMFLGVEDRGRGKSRDLRELNYYEVLVAYHVTHVIFIDSDYGLKYLDTRSYSREYQYILRNMEKFISNNHIDLVSEFLVCLKILRATDTPAFKKGIACVIGSQNDDGSWPKNIYSLNNKHTTIVSLWALRED